MKRDKKTEAAQMVTFVGNGLHPNLKRGLERQLNPDHAQRLVNSGWGEIVESKKKK